MWYVIATLVGVVFGTVVGMASTATTLVWGLKYFSKSEVISKLVDDVFDRLKEEGKL